jgi:hypothetical protein
VSGRSANSVGVMASRSGCDRGSRSQRGSISMRPGSLREIIDGSFNLEKIFMGAIPFARLIFPDFVAILAPQTIEKTSHKV